MRNREAYGRQLSEAFRAPNAPSLVARVLQKSTLAVTELKCDRPDFGRTAPLPREDAYLIALQLRACPNHDLYFEGRLTRPENYAEGVTSIYDLRRGPVADIRDPYHSLMFYLPRQALDALAADAGLPRPGDLRHTPGVSVDDPVVRHLLSSLLPLTAKPEQANSLFFDHVALAMTAHMACTYGGMNGKGGIPPGGLSAWQQRRAKELMSASIAEELPLSRLASECGLSVRHFARAFRRSTGMPPHRWLLRHRVERAQELLGKRALSLADVAAFCGFADQSHFTRVFTAMVGVTPGVWRRMHGAGAACAPR
ncbi:MAG TPA: AraC family transcriptional regulator [Verrucomicrobiae bacterium]|nr:AraC family transcriptional regulator [Verrucomicrobiae bacterium]